ncbi:MAG: hypothetical protein ACFE9R_04980 [Candidatus Hermodarchaeota archaeon]
MSKTEKEKKIEYVPFVGTVEAYLSRSPWDFYSWGHIALGIASFSILSLLITVTEVLIGPSIFDWWMILLFTIAVAIIWEILENTVILWWGWRPRNRRDSFVNALWDIIFVTIGGASTWLIKWIVMDLNSILGRYFYISAILFFVIIMIAYFLGFYFTSEKTKQARRARKKVIS